jgi:hypothetical protein
MCNPDEVNPVKLGSFKTMKNPRMRANPIQSRAGMVFFSNLRAKNKPARIKIPAITCNVGGGWEEVITPFTLRYRVSPTSRMTPKMKTTGMKL